MNRRHLINTLLRKTSGNSYLEIGVRDGKTIAEINAKIKIGVDPAYQLSRGLALKSVFGLSGFKLFKQTSDDFFASNATQVFSEGIDLVFIDGLHNYDQSLRDVVNALRFLNPKGYLVLHDCNPKGAAQAFPIKKSYDEVISALQNGGIEGWTGEWNGDVWKTVVHLRAFRPDLKVLTIDSDQGLGVISFGKNDKPLNTKQDDLESAGYAFLEANRTELLGLISDEEFLAKLNG